MRACTFYLWSLHCECESISSPLSHPSQMPYQFIILKQQDIRAQTLIPLPPNWAALGLRLFICKVGIRDAISQCHVLGIGQGPV